MFASCSYIPSATVTKSRQECQVHPPCRSVAKVSALLVNKDYNFALRARSKRDTRRNVNDCILTEDLDQRYETILTGFPSLDLSHENLEGQNMQVHILLSHTSRFKSSNTRTLSQTWTWVRGHYINEIKLHFCMSFDITNIHVLD